MTCNWFQFLELTIIAYMAIIYSLISALMITHMIIKIIIQHELVDDIAQIFGE